MNNTSPMLVLAAEQEKISRALLAWLNQYPGKPVERINFEYLTDDIPGMALSVIQGAFKAKQYLRRKYQAQYQFKLIYRIQTGNEADNNARLKADELLDAFGDWAASNTDYPDIGPGKYVQKISVNSRATMFGRYDNGDEDHQILMTMDYISM